MRETERGNDESDDHARVNIELDLLLATVRVAGGGSKRLDDEEKEGRDEFQSNQIEEGKSIPPIILVLVSGWILQPHHKRYDPISRDDCG